jgi:hypothetical protein
MRWMHRFGGIRCSSLVAPAPEEDRDPRGVAFFSRERPRAYVA